MILCSLGEVEALFWRQRPWLQLERLTGRSEDLIRCAVPFSSLVQRLGSDFEKSFLASVAFGPIGILRVISVISAAWG